MWVDELGVLVDGVLVLGVLVDEVLELVVDCVWMGCDCNLRLIVDCRWMC